VALEKERINTPEGDPRVTVKEARAALNNVRASVGPVVSVAQDLSLLDLPEIELGKDLPIYSGALQHLGPQFGVVLKCLRLRPRRHG
jgi:hypothetical protein